MKLHIGTLLTILTGRMMCPLEDLYKALTHLARREVYSHQMTRVMREAIPHLRRTVPSVAGYAATLQFDKGASVDWNAVRARGAEVCGGEWFDVPPLPGDDITDIDPYAELVKQIGKERVFVVRPSE